MSKSYVFDRVESGIAVLIPEKGKEVHIPESELPGGAHEGATLIKNGGKWEIDAADTIERHRRIAFKIERLFSDD